MSANVVALECINVLHLVPEDTDKLGRLADGKVFSKLLGTLKNRTVSHEDISVLSEDLEKLLSENFSSKLVDFELAFSGNEHEICKVCVLLIYLSVLSSSEIRNNLSSSELSTETQYKLKYLLECLQQRGHGISRQYLDILITEVIDISEMLTGTSIQTPRTFRNISFLESPKGRMQSPLRAMLQSPQFRMQRLLDAKNREVRDLRDKMYTLETEKEELQETVALSAKKAEKLEDEHQKLRERHSTLRKEHEELETELTTGDKVGQKVMELGKQLSQVRSENDRLSEEVMRISEENCELQTKTENLRSRLASIESERKVLEQEKSLLREANYEKEMIIDNQASELKEVRVQLEELHTCLTEMRASRSRSVESSYDTLPLSAEMESQAANKSCVSSSSLEGENLSGVVDKMLEETKNALKDLENKYSELEFKFKEAVSIKESFAQQRDMLAMELKEMEENLCRSKECCKEQGVMLKRKSLIVSDLEAKQKMMCEKYEEQVASIGREVAVLSRTVEEKTKLQNNLEAKLKQQQDVFNATIVEKNEKIDELTERVKSLQEEHHQEKESLLLEYDSLKNECSKVGQERDQLEKDLRLQENKFSEVSKVIEGKHNEINSLKSEFMAKVESVELALRQEREEREEEKQKLNQTISQAEERFLDEKEEKDKLVEEHKETCEQLQKEFDSVKGELSVKIDKLMSQLQEQKKLREEMKDQYDSEVSSKCRELTEKGKQLEELQEKHKSVLSRQEELKLQLEAMTSDSEKLSTKIANKDSEIEVLKRQLSDDKARFTEKEEQFTLKVKNLEQSVEQKENDLEAAVKVKQCEIDRLSEDINLLKSSSTDEMLQLTSKTELREKQLMEVVKKNEEETARLKDALAAKTKEAEQSSESVDELKATLEQKEAKSKEQQQMHNELVSKLNTLLKEKEVQLGDKVKLEEDWRAQVAKAKQLEQLREKELSELQCKVQEVEKASSENGLQHDAKLGEMESTINEQQLELSKTKQQLKEASESILSFKKQQATISSLTAEKESLTNTLREKEISFEESRKKDEEKIDSLSLLVSDLKEGLKEKNEQIKGFSVMENENGKLKTDKERMEKLCKELKVSEQNVQEKLVIAEQKLVRLQSEKAELDAKMAEIEARCQKENEALKSANSEQVSVNVSLSTKVGSLEDDLSRITKLHSEKKAELLNTVQEHESKCKRLSADLDKANSESTNLEKQLNARKKLVQEKTEANKSLHEQIKKEKLLREESERRALASEAALVDKEKGLAAEKEDAMRVQRECEKTIASLNQELKSVQEGSGEYKRKFETLKTTYRAEMETLMKEVDEMQKSKEDTKIVQQKYEVTKKKLADVVTKHNDERQAKEEYEKQVVKYKDCISNLTSDLKKCKVCNDELTTRIEKLEGEREPLKNKLGETEMKLKQLAAEKRSLEAQLRHAELQVRELQRKLNRESLGAEVIRRSQGTLSKIQQMKSLSSSSAEDEFNDSQTPLLQENSKSRQRGHRMTVEQEVAVQPASRAAAVNVVKTRSSSQLQRASGSSQTAFSKPRRTVSAAGVAKTVGKASVRSVPNIVLTGEPSVSGRQVRTRGGSSKSVLSDVSPGSVNARSLGRSVPRGMASAFDCAEEDNDEMSNKYLRDLKAGRCTVDTEVDWRRVSELQRRNSLYPPHMRSAYPAEMQFNPSDAFSDDQLREGHAVDNGDMFDLTKATEHLELDSPAFNLRKRKSLSESVSSESSLHSSAGKKTRRLSTSYSRPGPPTPGRRNSNKTDKEKLSCDASRLSGESVASRASGVSDKSDYATPPTRLPTHTPKAWGTRLSTKGSPTVSSLRSGKGLSPLNKKRTPASIRRILSIGKSPWRKLENDNTPKGGTDAESSVKRILRNPFGAKNYNVLSASLRSKDAASLAQDTLNTSKIRTRSQLSFGSKYKAHR